MVSTSQPYFSVLITSYNRPEHIAQCIESVLANDREDVEVIISDDASPQAETIVNAVQPYISLPNVQFHQQPTNIGEPANRNFLVSRARGQYNIILCDDDTLFPHALKTIRRYIERQPNHDLYMFGYRVMNASSTACYDRVAPNSFSISLDQPELIRQMFEGRWLPFLVFHPATFCCKGGVEKQLPYRKDVSTADDYMFLLECLNAGRSIFALPECLMTYRWIQDHAQKRQINQSSDTMKVLNAYTRVYYALQRKADLHPSVSRFIHGVDYRRSFLYETILRRMRVTDETGILLSLHPSHCRELAEYTAAPRRRMILWQANLMVAIQMMRLFNLKGMVYSVRVAVAYFKFKWLAMSIPIERCVP
jgi:glycosyltransferase involved in cell wall biosynthesis